MSTPSAPRFRSLDRDEIEAILARNHVGRIAFARGQHIDVEPIHYVYSDGWIYGRTSHGTKMEATGYTWWPVAFEVDEVEDVFRWRSVVVHGGFYTVSPSDPEGEPELWDHAVEMLRRVVPQTFTDEDPVAFRNVVFRIAVQEVTGREALPPEAPEATPTTQHLEEVAS